MGPEPPNKPLPYVVAGLTALIFVLDLLSPGGWANWLLYLIPLSFTLRTRQRRLPLVLAAV